MPEPQYIVAIIITGLGMVAFFMIKNWANNWETRLTAHDDRLGDHDVHIATLKANIEHIRQTADETRTDVKELLKQNGHRSSISG